jgi:uncharacterized membrane protein
VVPEERLAPVDMSVEEGIHIIVSAGFMGREDGHGE